MKSILTVLFSLILIFSFIIKGFSQKGWIHTSQGTFTGTSAPTQILKSQKIATDMYGNVYATMDDAYNIADTFHLGYTVLPNYIDSNLILVKYDASGNLLWSRYMYNGNTFIITTFITSDKYGNTWLCGLFNGNSVSFGGHLLLNSAHPSTTNFFIVKYDANGIVQWARNGGGYAGTSSLLMNVATDTFGNVYFFNEFTSDTLVLGNDTLYNSSPDSVKWDVYVAKYNNAGNEVWAKKATGIKDDQPLAFAVDMAGNIYAAGKYTSPTFSFGGPLITSSNNRFIVKFDSAGNVAWLKGLSDINITGLQIDRAGKVYFGGWAGVSSYTIGSHTLSRHGGMEFFIAKYDPVADDYSWVKNYGTTAGGGAANSLAIDLAGNIWIAGGYNHDSLIIGPDTLHYSIAASGTNGSASFLAEFDSLGNVLCTTNLVTAGINNYITTDNKGYVYLTGDVRVSAGSKVVIGSDTLLQSSLGDFLLAKFRPCALPIDIYTIEKNEIILSIYPNPASEAFIIQSNAQAATIELYNISGQLVLIQKTNTEKTMVDVSSLNAGMYFCKYAVQGEQPVIKKIMIVK